MLGEGIEAALESAFGSDVDVTHRDFGTGPVEYGGRALLREFANPAKGAIRSDMSKFDLVVDSGGGDSLTDIYGIKRLLNIFLIQRIVRRAGKELVLSPQTIGPFSSSFARVLGKSALRNASLVLARDPKSMKILEKMSVTSRRLSTDVVFNLPVPEVTKDGGVILNVSGLLYRGSSLVGKEIYQSQTKELIERLLADGKRITLLPHVLEGSSTDNDVDVSRELFDEYSSRGVELFVPANLEDARSRISSADILIGARMHACLNALSVGVPAVALAYSRKFEPLMKAVGWDAVIDLKESPEFAAQVMRRLETGLPNLGAVREQARAQSLVFVQALQALMQGKNND